jgi:homospermidine synthase
MTKHPVHIDFPGRIVLVGFGSIGQGVMPLILRHIGIAPDRISIVTADDSGSAEAEHFGVKRIKEALTRDNFRRILSPLIGRGDFLLNVSVDVSSVALIRFCWEKGAMYLDTCVEPWAGGYTDPTLSAARRTNYALREEALGLRAGNARAPTAVVTHGANPGMVSHLVKQGMLNIAADTGVDAGNPSSREDWAALAHLLGIRVIHIAERDTQVSSRPKQLGEFVNTWSVDGFVSEGAQPAELGWGTHERNFPRDGKRHDFGNGAAIYLMQPGAATRVRTWTPLAGHFHGFCITHSEAISISDYLTVREGGNVVYRPTAHYAYHPCDAAIASVHEFAGNNFVVQDKKRIMCEDVTSGRDELGVLLAGHKKNAYWYGSQLTMRPVCRSPRRASRAWSGRWRIRTAAWSNRMKSTSAAISRSVSPTGARSSAPTPTGPR